MALDSSRIYGKHVLPVSRVKFKLCKMSGICSRCGRFRGCGMFR